jgi:hypothetical protein
LAYSGEFLLSITLNVLDVAFYAAFSTFWIMDSGAIDHMTHPPNVFITYSLCPSSRKLVITDSSLTIVVGIGSVQINLLLTLQNVLMSLSYLPI